MPFLPAFAQGDAKRTRLILLGTKGGPRVSPAQLPKNPSNLILINGVPYVVDCGYGASAQLVTFGLPLNRLRHIFVTHHHSDHNLELGPLLYNGWATGLRERVDLYGPPGMARMRDAFFEYMKFDIETRMADEGRPDLRKLVVAHEFDKPAAGHAERRRQGDLHAGAPSADQQAYAYRFDARTARSSFPAIPPTRRSSPSSRKAPTSSFTRSCTSAAWRRCSSACRTRRR